MPIDRNEDVLTPFAMGAAEGPGANDHDFTVLEQ
jgi:hypothetical protein